MRQASDSAQQLADQTSRHDREVGARKIYTIVAALIDTNILVYRFDRRFPQKQEIATELLRRGIETNSIVVPHQAVIEFVAAVTRNVRGHVILQQREAMREAEEFLGQFTIVYPNEAIVRTLFGDARPIN